jgi:hypothetical protein
VESPRPPAPKLPARAPTSKTVTRPIEKASRVADSPRATGERERAASRKAPEYAYRGANVAVQLSVSDRREAQRDLSLLLVRLGGSKVGSDEQSFMRLLVPRSRYGEFTRGLAQIGSWQVDQGSLSLPDPVVVTVKLTK